MQRIRSILVTIVVILSFLLPNQVEAKKADDNLPIIKVGEEISVELDEKTKKYDFQTINDGKFLQILKITSDKDCRISCEDVESKKSENLSIRYSNSLDVAEGNVAMFGDIPQDIGQYRWTVEIVKRKLPGKVKIKLLNSFPVEAASYSNELSGILIKNVPMAKVVLQPESDRDVYPATAYYNRSNKNADSTPDGDAILWVSPGIWRVNVSSLNENDAGQLNARMIPTFPGKMTVVNWPDNLGKFISPPADLKQTKLNINSTEIEKNLGKIDFTVLESSLVKPDTKNTEVIQGASKVQIIDIKRLQTPINTVLLLDSSGSMKNDMKRVLKEAATFVKNFDEKANISVVDFDTKPKLLKAKSRTDLLAKLKAVKANGATALYDSVILGLKNLEGKQRTSLILFTDGKDANYNDTRQGSKANAEQMFEAVKNSKIPVYTIGYGKSPDDSTLNRISELSGGAYYKTDEKNLEEVFKKIKQNLGNNFELTYKTPETQIAGDDPILLIMLDNSGSMNAESTLGDGCDRRIEKVRQALMDFVAKVPENVILEFGTFNTQTSLEQIATKDKAKIIRAIAGVKAGGGTNELLAIRDSYNALSVPSTRKYLIYITDAALEAKDDRQQFDLILSKIKDVGIKSIWVGIGLKEKYKKLFDYAAELSGGKSLLAKEPQDLSDMFAQILTELNKPVKNAEKVPVSVKINYKTPEGLPGIFAATKMVEKPKEAVTNGKPVNLDVLNYSFEDLKTPYTDSSASALIWGNDIALKDVRIKNRIPLSIDAQTKALNIHINSIYLLDRLRGYQRSGHQMVALDLELTNVLKKQKVVVHPDGSSHPSSWIGKVDSDSVEKMKIPPYLIPDLENHLFLRWNNSAEYPLSHATWLAEKPLILPGDKSVSIKPDQKVSGAIIFTVPDKVMETVSLHYYDSAYGNVDIPITGEMSTRAVVELVKSKAATKKLSDAFSIEIEGYSDSDSVAGSKVYENELFRTISMNLISNVEGLLKLDPAKRMFLRISTPQGWLIKEPHPVTKIIPFGFYGPAVLSPGSFNKEKLVFLIPEMLKDSHADLVVSLMGKDVVIPINNTPESELKLSKAAASEDGIDLHINDVKYLKKLDGSGHTLVSIDVTFVDKEDNTETRMHDPLIISQKEEIDTSKAYAAEHKGLGGFSSAKGKNPGIYSLFDKTQSRLFGMQNPQIIKDGYTQRMVALFKCNSKDEEVYLKSPIFKNLNYKINLAELRKTKFLQEESPLLGKEVEAKYPDDDYNEKAIRRILKTINMQRVANGFVKPGSKVFAELDADGKKEIQKEVCSVPSITIYGIEKFQTLTTIDQAIETIKGLRYVSSTNSNCLYSPEAVLTQGFGNELDFASLFAKVLGKSPVNMKAYLVYLTEKGKDNLKQTYKLVNVPNRLPAIKVGDDENARMLVFPMLKYTDEIPEFIEKIKDYSLSSLSGSNVTIGVKLVARKTSDSVSSKMGGMAGALGGSSNPDKEETFDMCSFSQDSNYLCGHALDIAFAKGKDNEIKAIAYGGEKGTIVGAGAISKDYKVQKIKIVVSNNSLGYGEPYEYELPEDTKITDNFFTIGINIPSLTRESIDVLNKVREAKKKSVSNPDTLSILQWHTRTIISKFVAAQSINEANLARELDLIEGRTSKSRVIIVGVARNAKKGSLQTRIDLKYVKNEPQSENLEAIKAFNIMSGLFNTVAEATALGKDGISVATLWKMAKSDETIMVTNENKRVILDFMEGKEFSKSIVDRIKRLNRDTFLLIPVEPAIIDNKQFWGWLEVNRDDYSIASLLQNSEHGALVESTIMEALSNSGQAVIGFLKGVETSVWAVSAVSFQEEDYKKILAKAKKLATALKDNLSNVGKSLSDIIDDALTADSDTSVALTGTKISLKDLLTEGKLLQPNISTPDLKSGYEAGVNYYFEHAK